MSLVSFQNYPKSEVHGTIEAGLFNSQDYRHKLLEKETCQLKNAESCYMQILQITTNQANCPVGGKSNNAKIAPASY